jgi:hypothetical protein
MVVPVEIHVAAVQGKTEVLQEWFSTGACDVNEIYDWNGDGYSLLEVATRQNSCDMMRMFLARGADVNSTSDECDCTPLHFAAMHGHCEAVSLLLDHGAQIDARTASGNTPMILAARQEHDRVDMIRLLLRRGAVFDARDKNGENAEAHAIRFKLPEMAAFLADVRRAGGLRAYMRYPRFRLLMLLKLVKKRRAKTEDDLLVRLFPTPPPQRTREATKRAAGLAVTELPQEVFWLVVSYWRSSRDYLEPDRG